MNVIYFGTPDFAVNALTEIAKRHNVSAVVTQPDKPQGRGHELTAPPVKKTAESLGIPVYQPAKIKNEELYAMLEEYKPDVIVVCAYGKILPGYILDYPKYGCINIHASLLPMYRGAAPIQRCIMNGEKESGVTIMKMDEGLDTGDMIISEKVEITDSMTYGELHDILSDIGADLICKALDGVENGTVTYTKQSGETCYSPMIEKSDCKLDFSEGFVKCINRIRGLSPTPLATFMLDGKSVKAVTAVAVDEKIEAGMIPDGKRFIIGTGDGAIEITKLRPEGKKEMDGKGFMAGRRGKGGKAE